MAAVRWGPGPLREVTVAARRFPGRGPPAARAVGARAVSLSERLRGTSHSGFSPLYLKVDLSLL